MRRRDGFDKGFLLLLVIILILVGTGVFLYAQVRTDKVAELVKKGKPFSIALFVTDTSNVVTWKAVPQTSTAVPGGVSATGQSASLAGNSSTTGPGGTEAVPVENNKLLFTEVLSFDPKTHKGALLDIPGNVGSLIGSIQKIDRIDVLFKPGKVDAYRNKIASMIGNSIPLYIEMDISDIPKVVDLLGGVNLFIANPVDQPKSNPMVMLPSGSVTLDGAKVQSYLDYKASSDSDIELISRRQRFVQALLKAIGEHAALFDKSGVYPAFKGWVTTNMNHRSMLSFVDQMSRFDSEKMVFQHVLGVDRTVDNQQLLFPHYDGRLLRETMQQTLASLANPQALGNEALTTRLQILNGTLVSGLAHRTSQIFQSFGYDVVAVGNAEKQDYAKTEIIDRTGNISQAQKVGAIIKCTLIQSQPQVPTVLPSSTGQKGQTGAAAPLATPTYDVTIILGKNFDGRYCK